MESYQGIELRKIPSRFRIRLSQILDVDESWKKLMSSIPSETNANLYKYKAEHIGLIERYSITQRKLPGEILFEEWSTSGKIRPKVETLYDLLINCELFRAADYVATEILNIPCPSRPLDGPAKKVVPLLLESDNRDICNNQNETLSTVFIGESENGSIDSVTSSLVEKLNNFNINEGNLIDFNIELLEKATANFSEAYNVGSGAFGTVYYIDLKGKGCSLAIKLLHPASSVIEEQFLTEIRVLSEYRHTNLLSLIGFSTNGPRYCLVYEYMAKGNLLDALSLKSKDLINGALSWRSRIKILDGILRGLHYLHLGRSKPLIHRDIKSSNILLNEQLLPKIGDFGLAKSLQNPNQTSALTSTIFGSGAYMAPEAFRGDISTKMDIFSYGVVVLEVLTGLGPYDENREGNDIVTYLEELIEDEDITPFLDENAGYLDTTISSGLYRIATKCHLEKKRRPTSAELLIDISSILEQFNITLENEDNYLL